MRIESSRSRGCQGDPTWSADRPVSKIAKGVTSELPASFFFSSMDANRHSLVFATLNIMSVLLSPWIDINRKLHFFYFSLLPRMGQKSQDGGYIHASKAPLFFFWCASQHMFEKGRALMVWLWTPSWLFWLPSLQAPLPFTNCDSTLFRMTVLYLRSPFVASCRWWTSSGILEVSSPLGPQKY